MNVVAFLGSPRKEGNSEILLNECLNAVQERGHFVRFFRPSEMNLSPCLNCGGCDESGICVVQDDMGEVYESIRRSDRVILSSPIFFFGLTAQIKAVIDRCQAFWCEKYLLKKPIPEGPHGRKGLLLLVGGMKKEIGYKCGDATATAFFRTINVNTHETLRFEKIDSKGEILKHPTALSDVYKAGMKLIS
ncbi:MAG: hypothetical protein BV458_10970 [Thermoplasmata archaeon M9B2D]|nr:MAG: hypothetical protein BV458_10970 [Thermoplasmata archaeon M9B2D]